MNSTTDTAASAATTPTTLVGQLNSVHEMDSRLADMQNQLNQMLARREELRVAAEAEKRERAQTLPKEWGFDSMDSFIGFLRSVAPRTQAAKGLRVGRAFSPELVAKLKEMIKDGKSAGEVKRTLGVSAPSFYAYKHDLGLTKVYNYPKGSKLRGKGRNKRAHKSRPQTAAPLAKAA
jgi:hypothetical protein